MSIGRNALYFEDYVLSIQYFNQVIRAKPYMAEPYLFRAIAKLNLDDYKGAEDDITLCLERNPFLVYAYQCRGAARHSLQDYTGAIADYSKGLKYRPEDKQMLLNKGIAFAQMKDYDDAVLVLDTLLRFHPKFTNGYLTRGSVFAEKGDTINALTDYNKAVSLDKYYAPVYGQRGLLYFQMDSLKNALADLTEAIRLNPKQEGYYINRGLVRYHLNDLRGTMSDYDIVIDMDPNNIIARFNRGLLRAQVGDNNRSIEDFDVVIKQEPDNFSAIFNRALLREEIGDYRGAVADFNSVLEEYPNFVPGYYARSMVKKQMHDIKGSDQDYWLAYELEQKLRKEKAQGKKITGKGIIDENEEEIADNEKTREKSDKNIEKFNRLIVYDKSEEESSKYKNEIRGRVQDKNVKVDLSPQFAITFYEKVETFKRPTFADKMIADYNRKLQLPLQLQITNNEAPLNDAQADYHFESINNYSLKLNDNPASADIYFCRGIDFMILQDLTEAMQDFDRAIDLDPNLAIAYFNRAVIRYKQLEINNYSQENKETLDMSLSIQTGKKKPAAQGQFTNPNETVNPQTEKDNRFYQYEFMLRDYDSVIQLNPDFIYAYFNKGNIYCAKKDFRSAVQEYTKAINKDAEFAEAYFNRGLTRLYLGDTEKGVADLSKAGELGIIDAYSIIKRMTAD